MTRIDQEIDMHSAEARIPNQGDGGSFITRMVERFSTNDMTTGNPYRLLIKFSIPLLIGNIFQQLYNTVDSIVVGNYVSENALAAVGSGFPFMLAITSLFIGVGLGAMIIISQYAGAKRYEDIQMTVTTFYRAMLVAVIPISILGIILARPVLVMINTPPETLQDSVRYLQIVFLGLIGTMGYNMNAGLLQGIGDSATSLLFLILSTVVNIVLDLVFVLVCHWGITGVAVATIIAQFTSWIMGIFYINRKISYIHIDLRRLPYVGAILKRAFSLGMPSGLQQMLFAVGAIVFQSIVNLQGRFFLAGFTGANKIDSFVFMPIQSITIAISTYTAQNFGANRIDRIHSGKRAGIIISVGAALVFGLGIYPFSGAAMSLFNQHPKVIEGGVIYLHSLLPFYTILAILFALNSLLRGLGRVMVPLLSTFVSMWLIRIPAAYLLVDLVGPHAVYYSYVIGWSFGLVISLLYYHFGNWQKKAKEDYEKNIQAKI